MVPRYRSRQPLCCQGGCRLALGKIRHKLPRFSFKQDFCGKSRNTILQGKQPRNVGDQGG